MSQGPRERLLTAAIDLVRERGVEGAGIADILDRSSSARRSVYQHFPGGKTELVATSTRVAGAWMRRSLRELGAGLDPAAALTAIVTGTSRNLAESGFLRGCPIAAAAAAAPEHAQVREAAAEVFDGWVDELATGLVDAGHEPAVARSLAGFTVSAVEGALLRARAAGSAEPLDEVLQHLVPLLESR